MERHKALPESPGRILLLMCHWLGDTFWAMQVVPAIKKRYPDAEIFVGVKEFSRGLFWKMLPEDRILTFTYLTSDRTRENFSFCGYLKNLLTARKLKSDIVIDMMGNRYSALFAYFSGASLTIGPDPADELAELYTIKMPLSLMRFHHLIYKPAVIAAPITGYDFSSEIVPFPVIPCETKKDFLWNLNSPEEKPLVLLLPGAGWKLKQWDASKFQALAEILEKRGYRILLSGAPNEYQLCRRIAENLHDYIILPSSLLDVVAVLSGCCCVISNDSGVAHLAAAAGMNVISLFCCTNPEFCRPLGDHVRVLRSSCPALPLGSAHFCDASMCAEYHMNITIEEVLRSMEEMSRSGRKIIRDPSLSERPQCIEGENGE